LQSSTESGGNDQSTSPQSIAEAVRGADYEKTWRLFDTMLRKIKQGEAPPFRDATLSEEDRQWLDENYSTFLREHLRALLFRFGYSPKGRKLRKTSELPRPDLPSDAPENRTRKIVSMTLPPDVLGELNERCRDLGIDRTSFIEVAVRAALDTTS